MCHFLEVHSLENMQHVRLLARAACAQWPLRIMCLHMLINEGYVVLNVH
jgi:hypothetical protein